MADFEPPSFSLGLDLDSQAEPGILSPTRPSSPVAAPQHCSADAGGRNTEDPDDLNGLENEEVMDSDPEPEPEATRIFKRLRRGPGSRTPSTSSTAAANRGLDDIPCGNGDEDIEEFSSQEDLLIRDSNTSTRYHSVCSSSKIPLRGSGVLTTQLTSQRKTSKENQGSEAPSSVRSAGSNDAFMFPKLTVSPLRRFQLLDSDSDSDDDITIKSHITESSSKKSEPTSSTEKRKVSEVLDQNEDLWKDFCPIKSARVATPVLDEICEEYFTSLKGKNVAQKVTKDACRSNSGVFHSNQHGFDNFERESDLGDSNPLAQCYFFHSDPRVQNLVRSRLPHFSPMGLVANRGNQQSSASGISYKSQFSKEKASNQKGTKRGSNVKGSARGRSKSNKSKAEEVVQASGGWVEPKSTAPVPMDAGKRRVHASGQSSGHWYTSSEGKKVYVSKTGQELTGQFAYRQYKKDSGGFRKSKKKTGGKKKAKS